MQISLLEPISTEQEEEKMMHMGFNIENRRYTGSKAKLTDWIFQIIKQECSGEVFADIFAGTGVVSAYASQYFKKIIVNDILFSNQVIYKAFFGNEKWDKEKVMSKIKFYKKLNSKSISENFFSKNFGNKYFGLNDAKIIGFIREDVEKGKGKLNEKEYCILLASLIYSIDRISNTVGHYDAYIRKKPRDNLFNMELIETDNTKSKVEIYRDDANNLIRRIVADVVYIDPPYNSRQYSRFYHVLETLVKWEKPELFGTALKPKPENMSDYCRVKAIDMFEDLISNLKCKYIVVSYNNTYESKSNSSRNKMELKDIREVLEERGKIKVFNKSYQPFNSGKTTFDNHQEFIFLTKVNNI